MIMRGGLCTPDVKSSQSTTRTRLPQAGNKNPYNEGHFINEIIIID